MELSDCLLLVVAVGAGDLAITSFHIPAIRTVGKSGWAVVSEGTLVPDKP
jgi:hypothetical protein